MAPATGECSACGYEPVAFDALACPRCGARAPNPGVTDRYAGLGTLLGLTAGACFGAAWGYLGWNFGWAGALGGALLGALPGIFVGLVGGLIAGAVARLSGKR